ncbi:rod-binding protein [Botrimarina hoheduenensis]|uniref:Rod binding protein n=1 Tax=Botrimarina hoheduenensis TaxID=2528000 RepID=A0A5C5VWE2_9BACT|nr:rod-binding protein [Botrimarina hoheduenensis]TWT42690.1 Rod binding protein [Botrimarina hoheduenensis]
MSPLSSITFQQGLKPADPVTEARELKETFGQFVGETLFGTMLKVMRESVGEPAYFHGGSAEKHFQSRLDAQMATNLAEGQGASISEALFEQQFPGQARLLAEATPSAPLDQLNALRRY